MAGIASSISCLPEDTPSAPITSTVASMAAAAEIVVITEQ